MNSAQPQISFPKMDAHIHLTSIPNSWKLIPQDKNLITTQSQLQSQKHRPESKENPSSREVELSEKTKNNLMNHFEIRGCAPYWRESRSEKSQILDPLNEEGDEDFLGFASIAMAFLGRRDPPTLFLCLGACKPFDEMHLTKFDQDLRFFLEKTIKII